MIRVNVFRNKTGDICGFRLKGHADFAEAGSDIVCSAVSVLTINTINCIELFTKAKFECKTDENKGGYLSFALSETKDGRADKDAQLLFEDYAQRIKRYRKRIWLVYIDKRGGALTC